MDELLFQTLTEYGHLVLLLLPLGIIGAWRWSVWLIKEVIALGYRPDRTPHSETVSIITPVYNEDPDVFKQALISWQQNAPSEIIAVIDHSDQSSIDIFTEFSTQHKNTRLIVTTKPGKRPALVDGISVATSDIVALVDSDTIWAPDTMKHALSPFHNPKIGGVGTRQNVLNPRTLAQRIFDMQLDNRYFDEMPFLAAGGTALTCLSGRTAFYRRSVVTPLLPDLLHELFWGRPVISGDDKRLTYLVEAAGWQLAYQSTSHVFTPGTPVLKNFFDQRLRWSRNSWRSDLRALYDGWVWKHPALAFHLVDRILQPFTLLLGPIFMLVSLALGLWQPAVSIIVWWHVSRFVKNVAHFRRRPVDILILPLYIVVNIVAGGLIKLYALFTLNTQGWITRWDQSRLARFGFVQRAPAYLFTAGLVVGLTAFVLNYKDHVYSPILASQKKNTLVFDLTVNTAEAPAVLGIRQEDLTTQLPFKRYQIQSGDSVYNLSQRFQLTVDDLVSFNQHLLPRRDVLRVGMVINIPRAGSDIQASAGEGTLTDPPARQVVYDAATNTITLKGRGHVFNLESIRQKVGDQILHHGADGEWTLAANLDVRSGAVLLVERKEVAWLKLVSNAEKQVWIRTQSGVIEFNGSKVTSWDDTQNSPDINVDNGRSYIVAKYPARLDIYDAELAYLGAPPAAHDSTDPSYGVAWKNIRDAADEHIVSGEVKNSIFHHNFYGTYVYGGSGMVWEKNSFYENQLHGASFQDLSINNVFQNNQSYQNGADGVVWSDESGHNLIVENSILNNRHNGISMRKNSGGNLLQGNTIFGNNLGISLSDSAQNVVIQNEVYQNKIGIALLLTSTTNVFTENKIYKNADVGLSLDSRADSNQFANNSVTENTLGWQIKSSGNELTVNTIADNGTGVMFSEGARDNKIAQNAIQRNAEYGVLAKTYVGAQNVIGENVFFGNNFDSSSQ